MSDSDMIEALTLTDVFIEALRKQYPELDVDGRVCMLHQTVKDAIP